MSNDIGKLYQPSSGTEGEGFIDSHCMRCIHCDPDPHGEKQCTIFGNAVFYSIGDPEYPKEWVYGTDGKPTCTAWRLWDWNEKGNPDNPDNPNYVQSEDPAQLKLFIDPANQEYQNQSAAEAEGLFCTEVEDILKSRMKEEGKKALADFDAALNNRVQAILGNESVRAGDGILPMIEQQNEFRRISPDEVNWRELKNNFPTEE